MQMAAGITKAVMDGVKNIVVFSGDEDFIPFIDIAEEQSVKVSVVGVPKTTNAQLIKRNLDNYISLKKETPGIKKKDKKPFRGAESKSTSNKKPYKKRSHQKNGHRA
jgi:uncharacterized LabA/DUF88 family protein